jgi:hypothetical protein
MLTPAAPWIETCSQLLLSRELARLLGLPEGAMVTPVVAGDDRGIYGEYSPAAM